MEVTINKHGKTYISQLGIGLDRSDEITDLAIELFIKERNRITRLQRLAAGTNDLNEFYMGMDMMMALSKMDSMELSMFLLGHKEYSAEGSEFKKTLHAEVASKELKGYTGEER